MKASRRALGGGTVVAVVAVLVSLFGCQETTVEVLPVAAVEVSPTQLSVVQGDHEDLTATPRTSGGQALGGRSVLWASSNPAVASVSSQGQVEGIGPGTTRIQATVEGVSGSADIRVLPGRIMVLSAVALQVEGIAGDAEPIEREVAVMNGGAGTLDGLEASVLAGDGGPTDWLQPTLAAATAPTTLHIRAHVDGLDADRYEARIALSSPRALNSPLHVQVTLDVREPDPVLALDPVSLSLSARAGSHQPATQSVSVMNMGGGLLDGLTTSIHYDAAGPVSWLSVELDGTTAPTEMTLRASARHLSAGDHSAVVRVSSPAALNGVAEVSVTFGVGEQSLGQNLVPERPGVGFGAVP